MKKQLIILSQHKPIFTKSNSVKYHAPYGVPCYGFHFQQNAESIISDAIDNDFMVFVSHANGNNYIAKKHHLINIDKREDINLLYNHYVWDEVIVDQCLQVVRIYIDGRRK